MISDHNIGAGDLRGQHSHQKTVAAEQSSQNFDEIQFSFNSTFETPGSLQHPAQKN